MFIFTTDTEKGKFVNLFAQIRLIDAECNNIKLRTFAPLWF